MSKHTWLGSNRRKNRPGYEERYNNRQKQGGPASPQKNKTYLAGPSRPPAPGVGKDRDNQWSTAWVPVPNHTRMEG